MILEDQKEIIAKQTKNIGNMESRNFMVGKDDKFCKTSISQM
jgi:hypothetical protein